MSTKEKDSNEVAFNIEEITLIDRKLSKPPIEPINNHDWIYTVRLEISMDAEKGKSIHTINIAAKLKSNRSVSGEITVACAFVIFNFNEVAIFENDTITLPANVVDLLNTVTIGTGRGVFFSEFRGTFLEKAVFPIVDPKKFHAA